jgi:hypothetical protein
VLFFDGDTSQNLHTPRQKKTEIIKKFSQLTYLTKITAYGTMSRNRQPSNWPARIAQLVQGRSTDWKAGERFSAGARNCYTVPSVQTAPKGPFLLRWNRQEGELDHSAPFSSVAEKYGALPPLPHTSSRSNVQLIKHMDNVAILVNY